LPHRSSRPRYRPSAAAQPFVRNKNGPSARQRPSPLARKPTAICGTAKLVRLLLKTRLHHSTDTEQDMLFDVYEQKGLLFNMNFKEANGNYAAYRGDLVLQLGEVGDALGHRKPPECTIKNTIVLAEGDKIKLYVGSLDDLADLPKVLAYYKADFAADVRLILFVVNINKPLVIELDGYSISAIGMQEGLIWNELIDLAALDKGDFKGQSASEKIITVYKALGDYKAKGDKVSFDEALKRTVELKRAGRGPV
jgi:hypothetical protein